MNKEIIKSVLLKKELFVDNEYLDKYCQLIEDNEFRKEEKFKTNIHHIIPKHVFKQRGLKYDDTSRNKINLLFKDHVLAHYYLYMCANDKKCKSSNDKAIRCLLKENWKNNNLLDKLDSLQEEYEKDMSILSSCIVIKNILSKLEEE